MKIRLETAAGELVGRTDIPPFLEAPAVLLWGDRVFTYTGRRQGDTLVYAEAFTVAVVQPVTS